MAIGSAVCDVEHLFAMIGGRSDDGVVRDAYSGSLLAMKFEDFERPDDDLNPNYSLQCSME